MQVDLISANEGEFQPLGLSSPAAYLRARGFDVSTSDRTKTNSPIQPAGLVAFSVPIFGAIEDTLKLATELRTAGYDAPIVYYNQYATVQPETFIRGPNDVVVMGEYEEVLVELADAYAQRGLLEDVPNVASQKRGVALPRLKRAQFLRPDRVTLPALSTYARTRDDIVVGNIETMRGCAHDCTYCSVYAAYNKRVIKIQEEVVHADIDQVVSMGAGHITFVDADFYSTGDRGYRIIQSMKVRYPNLTFDITCRLDDILRYRKQMTQLKELGCTEITTAVEFPSDRVLTSVTKRITLAQTREAILLCRGAGLRVRPTFITFNPWINRADFAALDAFIDEMGVEDAVDELQRETRLLLYKGSPLLRNPQALGVKLIEHPTYFEWQHTDPQMDELYKSILTPGSDARKRCCIKG